MIGVSSRICECGNPVLTSGRGNPPHKCHVCAGRALPAPSSDDLDRVALWISEHRHDHCLPVSNTQTRNEARRMIEEVKNGQE